VKEGILSAEVAVPAAAFLAAMTGASRVALGWHWGTDVVGGWLTGIAVAAGATALYDELSDGSSAPRTRRRRWHG
jgi:undecaprenyl-diphosphatase